MTPDDLQNIGRLYIPRIHLIGVESSSEHQLAGLVQGQTVELALYVRAVSPEFFVLDGVVGVHTSVQTAGEERVSVGELDISDASIVLCECSQTQPGRLLPEFDLPVGGARGNVFAVLVGGQGSRVMNQALLAEHIALRLPLPDYDLAGLLDG